jgi:alkylated DNA repair dioxygenase AlkB
LILLLQQVQERTGAEYNIMLGNRYRRGKDKIAFHSDREELGPLHSIDSISLGVTRTFAFRRQNGEEALSLNLTHGSLLFMGTHCQEHYHHGMCTEPIALRQQFGKTRINLTFRIADQIYFRSNMWAPRKR